MLVVFTGYFTRNHCYLKTTYFCKTCHVAKQNQQNNTVADPLSSTNKHLTSKLNGDL